jgi:hypothetical protein
MTTKRFEVMQKNERLRLLAEYAPGKFEYPPGYRDVMSVLEVMGVDVKPGDRITITASVETAPTSVDVTPEMRPDSDPKNVDFDRFGPPRRVWSIDAWEAELDRQERLRTEGYLRRWHGETWGWSRGEHIRADGTSAGILWSWTSSGTYLSSNYTAFEDHEKAWQDIVRRG